MKEKTIDEVIANHGARLKNLEDYFLKRSLTEDERDMLLDLIKKGMKYYPRMPKSRIKLLKSIYKKVGLE